jgi:hypothetical protein
MVVKFTLGQVNLTGYLRISLEKVADPGVEVYVTYVTLPFTTYVFVSPEIDPDDYYVYFRESPDNVSLGTLRSEAFFNAQSKEFDTERRFYPMGSLGAGMSWTATQLHDDYLKNKVVTGVEKEGFRYLQPTAEYTYDETNGNIDLATTFLSPDEVLVVELKYNVGADNPSPIVSNLFSATISVTASSYTISSVDKKKRFSLDCSGTVQAVTLPGLAGLTAGDFFYFEHKRSGVQTQTRILPAGTDKIKFNGFNIAPYELSEIWVTRGRSLYLRKDVISSTSYWEIIFDWDGINVGRRFPSTYKDMPGFLPEDGRLLDGDELPGLYWWVRNVLPSTHKVTDDTVVSGGYAHPADKVGLFVIHSSLKKFRLPNTQGISEKGLANFNSYGADATRNYDYPGGRQPHQVGETTVTLKKGDGYSGHTATANRFAPGQNGNPQPDDIIMLNATKKTNVENIGVIHMRHIG